MFFEKKKDSNKIDDLAKVAALLIHAAKIDENYSSIEEEIIKKTLLEIGANKKDLQNLIGKAKKIETNSVQILEFTKEVKNMDETKKIKIIETLWRIIYSNKEADIYETNLMRRLEGLLYISSDIMGSIKDRIKKENK
tara:strand:+ start:888 stop:1301 length:414 start_codon:yes stop_codon:yes gene_type:complete